MKNKIFNDEAIIKIAYSMLTSNQYKYGKNIPINIDIFKKIILDNVILDKDNIQKNFNKIYIPSNKNELTSTICKIIEKAYSLGIIYNYGLISDSKYKKITYYKNKNVLLKFLFTYL